MGTACRRVLDATQTVKRDSLLSVPYLCSGEGEQISSARVGAGPRVAENHAYERASNEFQNTTTTTTSHNINTTTKRNYQTPTTPMVRICEWHMGIPCREHIRSLGQLQHLPNTNSNHSFQTQLPNTTTNEPRNITTGDGKCLYREFSTGANSARRIFRTCPKKTRGKFRTS